MSLAALQFWVIVPAGFVATYCVYQLCLCDLTSVRRRNLILRCSLALGLVFGVGGTFSIVRISRSARPQVIGTITKLSHYFGKSSSTTFSLVDKQGRSFQLTCLYSPQLQVGQRLDVAYLDEYGSVLYLRVLSGPNTGYEVHKGDELNFARLSALSGALIALGGFVWWRALGRPQIPDSGN